MSDLNLQDILLSKVNELNNLNTLELANELNVDHQKVIGCMMSIQQTFANVLETKSKQTKNWQLSKEGLSVQENGSYEFIIFNKIPKEGIEQKELIASLNNPSDAKVGFSKAMQNGWILIEKSDGKQIVKKKLDNVDDKVKEDLSLIKDSKSNQVNFANLKLKF